jgi:hypothetical protein
MKRIITTITTGLTLLILSPAEISARGELYEPRSFFLGLDGGYSYGPGGGLRLSLQRIGTNVPLGIDLGAGYYHQVNPGDAEAARRIFINDNTGGTIEKHGYSISIFMNLKYRILLFRGMEFHILAGPRYTWYTAHFAFIGNNEAFDVKSDHWGLGGGIELDIRMTDRLFFTINLGLDYYFPSQLSGHGTYYYNPGGKDDVPRQNYTYEDADRAVNQPGLAVRAMLGVRYRAF